MSNASDPRAEQSPVGPPASDDDELDQPDDTVAMDPNSLGSTAEGSDATPETPPSPDRV